MFPKKSPIRGPLLIILIVISIFAFALYSEESITGMAPAEVTGDIVKITGMQTSTEGISTFNNPVFKTQDNRFLYYEAKGSDQKTYTIQLFKAEELKGTVRIYKNSYAENVAKGFKNENPNYIWANSEPYEQIKNALKTVNSDNVGIDWWYTNPQITATPTQPTTTPSASTPQPTGVISYNEAEKQWYQGSEKINTPPTGTTEVTVTGSGQYQLYKVTNLNVGGSTLLGGGKTIPSTSAQITQTQTQEITWRLQTPSGVAYETAVRAEDAISNYRTKVGDSTNALSITATKYTGPQPGEPGTQTYIMVLKNDKNEEVYQTFQATQSSADSIANVYLNDRKLTSGVDTWTINKEPTIQQTTAAIGMSPDGQNLFLQGMDPAKDSGLPMSIRPDGLYDTTINYRDYLYNPNTGKLTLKSISTPDGRIDLSKVTVTMIDPSTKTLTLTIDGKTSIARYDEVKGTYKIEGTDEEFVYSGQRLYQTVLTSGAGKDAIYTNKYSTYQGTTGEYEPLFVKDGKYYNLNGNLVTSTQVLKTPTKIGEVTVSEIYKINAEGEISSESTGRRITEANQYIDISEETYEELGLSEGDRITISAGSITRTDSKGYTTTLTKAGNEEKIVTQEGDIKTTIIYDTQSKNKKTITYNSKSKTIREQIVSANGNTLTMNYKGSETSKIFQSGTFKTSDGRTIELENEATAKAAEAFGNQIIDALTLIRETDGTLKWDMNDKNWEFKNGQLITDQGTTVRKASQKEGTGVLKTVDGNSIGEGTMLAIKESGVVYAKTENGYIYWAGEGVTIDSNGNIQIAENKYSITQEFPSGGTIGTGDHTIELKKGTDAYVRTDKGMLGKADGTYVYVYGELAGVVIQDGSHKGEAYTIDTLFDENGKWKDNDLLGDSGAQFMKNQFTQWNFEAWKKSGLWGILGRRLKSGYDAARGGRALSTLLGCEDDNFCSDWRRKMDNFFANNVLGQVISGRWEDSLCHSQIPKDKAGVMNFNLPGNIIGVGAHVGAERTTTIYPNGTQIHLYRISYGINNPKFEEPGKSQKLEYNIILYGERDIKVFKQDREIGEGEIIRGAGTSPDAVPPKYSPYLYTQVCLKFSEKVETASGKYKDEVCNTISSYQGSPTIYREAKTTAAAPTPGGTGAAEEGEFNDF